MDFGAFLGNDALKRRLQESFRQGKTSHCYLLCGVEGSGRRTLALQMAAALECKNEREPGCGVCPACRKVLAKQHPDVITVDDTEHKNVAVDIVRQARSDVFIRPNEGRKKVYIIPRGQDLGAPSQNALLKILEEPPEYAVFLILTTSAEKLLPTIRSRAVQLQLSPLSYEQAIPELKRRFPDKRDLELADALEQAEGYLGPACEALRDGLFLPQALALANGFAARDGPRVLSLMRRTISVLSACRSNFPLLSSGISPTVSTVPQGIPSTSTVIVSIISSGRDAYGISISILSSASVTFSVFVKKIWMTLFTF